MCFLGQPQKLFSYLEDLKAAIQPKLIRTTSLNQPSCVQISREITLSNFSNQKHLPFILIVDASHVNRMVMHILLSAKYPELMYAENQQVALDILDSKKIVIILMDIHLPGQNGLDLSKQIKESQKYANHIIMFAVSSDTSCLKKPIYSKFGIDNALAKPLT